MGYMSELLGLGVPDASSPSHESKMPSASSMHAKLVKADLNGALLTGERGGYLARSPATDPYRHFSTLVRQSRNPCLVGLSGIVLHETENAFKLITRKNQLKRTSGLTHPPPPSHRLPPQSSRNRTPSSHLPYRSTRHTLRRLPSGIPHRRSNKIQKRCGRCSINPISSLIYTETSSVFVLRIGRIGNLKPKRRSSYELSCEWRCFSCVAASTSHI